MDDDNETEPRTIAWQFSLGDGKSSDMDPLEEAQIAAIALAVKSISAQLTALSILAEHTEKLITAALERGVADELLADAAGLRLSALRQFANSDQPLFPRNFQ